MTAVKNLSFENRLWSEDEAMPRAQVRELQLHRLRECVVRTAQVPFYRDALTAAGVGVDDIRSLDDVRRLPFTTKEDLRQSYPLGLLAVPREKLARLHGSSGTTGRLTIVAYTAGDLDNWANLCARFLVAGGLRPEHLVHIAFGYGLFTGGFGLHYGVEKVGAAVLPVSAGNTQRQVMLLADLQAEVLICTPSYALNIAEVAAQEGIDPRSLHLKFAHFGGEPWTEDMRVRIERELDIQAFNNYGLSEVTGPGVSGECYRRDGMHIQEDHFLVECLDPDTLEPVPLGTPGELVITPLTKQAMPLLRYRTRDIAVLNDEPCVCGRTGMRMGRIIGRSDDMLIIRGVNVFPSQIEEALLRVDGAAPHYLIEVTRPGNLDELTVKVEMRPEKFTDSFAALDNMRRNIAHKIYSITGIHAKVELVKPQTLERSLGKARRVHDLRRETGHGG
ncbi:MAG: phenylacetate--CoA ligase family protein [Kiritimatiellia bacterium]|jgi:phenylacetate-CoA ligase